VGLAQASSVKDSWVKAQKIRGAVSELAKL